MRDPIAAILTVNGKVDRGLSRGTDRRELDFRGIVVVVVVVVLFNEIEIEKILRNEILQRDFKRFFVEERAEVINKVIE